MGSTELFEGYKQLLQDIKDKVQYARIQVASVVNKERRFCTGQLENKLQLPKPSMHGGILW